MTWYSPMIFLKEAFQMERFEPLKKWIHFEGKKALIFENVLER